MKKNSKNKPLISSIVGLIGLVIVTIGITYAVFTYTKLGTTDNTVTTGTLKFLYTENTGVKTGIKLTNALPISDTQGKALDGDNNVFDFSIEATNTGTETIPYEVTLRKKNTSTLAEENVKIYLTDRTESQESSILEPTKYSELTQTNINVGSEIEKTIYNGTVNGGEASYRKDFRLRMWIDETSNQTDINGKEFTAMVNVYSNAKVISEAEQELRSNADIQSVIVGDDTLTKVVDQDYDYMVNIPDTTTSIKMLIIPKNSLSNVEITKDNTNIVNGTNINPSVGENIYNVKVISADKSNTNEVKVLVKYIKTEKVSIFGKIYSALDTTPTLTTSSNNSNDLNGLYKSTATNTGDATYYFRGNVEDNYVSFAGTTWRIVRVNEDGTIRMIMQNGINNNTTYQFNSNYNNYSYMYYTNSNVKTQLESWYNTNIGNNEEYSKYVTSGNYYCEQAKVKYASSWTSGSATMTVYTNYIPNFRCTTDGNGKGLITSNVGLITYDEIVYAGGYFNQNNKNFYLYNNQYFWTMSPVGINSTSSRTNVWSIYPSGDLHGDVSDGLRPIRLVINIKSTAEISSGTGTSTDPFIIN